MQYVMHFILLHNRQFGAYVKGIHEDAKSILMKYRWPGNISEVKNCVDRIYNRLEVDTIIEKRHLPEYICESVENEKRHLECNSRPLSDMLRDYEKRVIEAALANNAWSKSKTADSLGISAVTLWRKMTALGITSP